MDRSYFSFNIYFFIVICESYTRIGSRNLKDIKLFNNNKRSYFTQGGEFQKPVPFFTFPNSSSDIHVG